MKKFISLILLSLMLNSTIQAQNSKSYQLLKNEGSLPNDFITPTSAKYKKDIVKVKSSNDGKRDKATKQDYYLQSNFAIDGMIRSGRVLFEKEYTGYLTKIIQELLKGEPKFGDVKVYILRSSALNAFAAGNGTIFVNIGLLARAENEAQLALILSHELAHVKKKHSLEFYLKADKLDKERAKSRRSSVKDSEIDEKQLARHRFSREHETEADTDGIERYLKTNYSLEQVDKTMNLLKFADLPYENAAITPAFFQVPNVVIPKTFWRDSIKQYVGDDESEDDSENTHPNIKKRREVLTKLIANQKSSGRKEFIVSQPLFEKMQKAMRHEMLQLYLHRHLYQEAFYTAFLLEKLDSSNVFAKKGKVKALYGLVKFRNNSDESVVAELINADSLQGNVQHVYHLLKKMPSDQLNVLAAAHAWKAAKEYPTDTELKRMAIDLTEDLGRYHYADLTTFKANNARSNDSEENGSTDNKKSKWLSKVDKKATKEATKTDTPKKEEKTDAKWFHRALEAYVGDSEFKKAFDAGKKLAKDIDEKEEDFKTARTALYRNRFVNGAKLGIPKVVVVSPSYVRYNPKNDKQPLDYLTTEANQKEWRETVLKNAKSTGINVEVLAKDALKERDTEKFNDMVLLNEWFSEQADAGSMLFVGTRQNEVEALAKKYGTDNFLWMGIMTANNAKGILFYAILYNVKTRTNEIIKYDFFNFKERDWIVDMHTYDVFNQIKQK